MHDCGWLPLHWKLSPSADNGPAKRWRYRRVLILNRVPNRTGSKSLRLRAPLQVSQCQLQPAELGMVVQAERVGNIKPIPGEQLQAVA